MELLPSATIDNELSCPKIASKVSESTEQRDRNDETFQDCTSCKIVGAAGFGGLGAYALRESRILSKAPGRTKAAVGLGVAGIGFIAGGIYRLFMQHSTWWSSKNSIPINTKDMA